MVRRLGAHDYGLIELTQTVVNTAGLVTINLEAALIRFLPEFHSQQWGRAVRRLTWLIFGAKAGLAAIAIAWRTRSAILTILGGMTIFLLLLNWL